MQAAGGSKRKVRVVRLALPRFDRPLEVIESPVDTTPDRLGEFREIRESNERISVAAYSQPAGTPGATGVERLRPREGGLRLGGGERGLTDWIFGDSSRNSTIQEVPGSGWLEAEPEATPQTHRLRPWGFPTVSPSHPSVFSHHGIQPITVEFSEKSRFFLTLPDCRLAVSEAHQ